MSLERIGTREAELDVGVRDVAVLEVARVGRVWETGEPLRPFVLLDENGAEIAAVSEFLHHMLADDARPSSLRSYAYELLAWFRFLRAIGVAWDAAGRAEARDFALWLKTARKPARCASFRHREPAYRQGDARAELRAPDPAPCSRGDPVVL